MQLTERHIIKSVNKKYKELDKICFLSKNLYNVANYYIRQEYIKTGTYFNYNKMDKFLNFTDNIDYKALPSKVSQQVLKLVDKNWKSFFQATKAYKKCPSKFLGCPKLPNYKHKVSGRNVAVYTSQALYKKELRKGIIKLSKTDVLIKTKVATDCINQVRVVPQNNQIVVEVVYTVNTKECKDNGNKIGIDLGLSNLITCVNNKNSSKFIINGRPLKSINQYYNKKKAELMSYIGGKGKSNKIIKLTNKRNNKIKHYLHCASKYVLNYCLTNDISKVIIGNNKNWKQGVNIGKMNNQNFVSIPYSTLIEQLKYKCLLNGIEVVVTEESYTSKCSFVHSEPMEHKQKYLGNRIKRGVYKVGNLCYNADVNGALNIIRKVVPTFSIRDYGIEGVVVHPIKVTL